MSERYQQMRRERIRRRRAEVYDWIQSIVTALLVCVLLFTFAVRMVGVIGTSMLETLYDGDRLLVSDLFYSPARGDIVVLRKLSFSEEPLVKRVIATEGQTVDIDFELGIVYVDGVALEEKYIREPTTRALDFVNPVTVPDGSVFVMGDNRNGSMDSRDERIGFIDRRLIIGKAYWLAFPGKDLDTGKPRWNRIGSIH